MGSHGFGFIVFIGVIFIGWLMWSSKEQKDMFLAYFWLFLIVANGGILLFQWLSRHW